MPETIIIDTPAPFVDARGRIEVLADGAFASVLRITSKTGSIRANHYHKTDYHYCWLQSGSLIYYQRPVGSAEKPEEVVIGPGQVFYTPPLYEHAMRFQADSVFLCFSRNSRHTEAYEADTVRVTLIT